MDIHATYAFLPGKAGENGAFLPLWMHLEDTAAVMDYLCEKRTPASVIRASGLEQDVFRRIGSFLARTHDIGKCTPAFVSKILPCIPNNRNELSERGLIVPEQTAFLHGEHIPHAMAGEVLLRSFGCPDGVCAVVGAHHGKPSDEHKRTDNHEMHLHTYPGSYYAGQRELWAGMQESILENALAKSCYRTAAELPTLSNCAQMLLCGLLIQADWLASNQAYFPLLAEDDGNTERVYSERAEPAFEKIAMPDAWQADIKVSDITEFFLKRFGFPPKAVQREAAAAAQNTSGSGGLMLIEAQMGVGKTEAALAAAEILAEKVGCGGMFFGLPTQATSNGIFPRLAQWAEQVSQDNAHTIRLVHGMAELNEEYRALFRGTAAVDTDGDSGLTVHGWFSGKKQALLADFVVGTVDTALMAALRQKHVMLRHLGLCGKVVIVDECHAYDAYMSRFLLRMLNWLGAYQVPVILLSATLPAEKKHEMVQAYCVPYKSKKKITLPESTGYPLITWADRNSTRVIPIQEQSHSTDVSVERLTDVQLADVLRMRLSEGGCAGIIVNTVKRAQKLAEQLRQTFQDKTVLVYHAQYIAQERIRREKELIERIGKKSSPEQRNQVIIVGTQVLEQSLDIDFDYLITELCPMDLLLQRMGRLHRHARIRPAPISQPICSVLGTEEDCDIGSVSVYGEWLLKQSERYLPETVRLPEDIPKLVNRVYAEPNGAETDDPAWVTFRDRTEIKEQKADSWCLPRPKASVRESGNSIIGMLDSVIESDKKAEASVRDGASSVDVLVMCRQDADHVGFLPWIDNMRLRCDTVPSEEEARQIASQRLRLPFVFGIGRNADAVIDTLEQENIRWLSQW